MYELLQCPCLRAIAFTEPITAPYRKAEISLRRKLVDSRKSFRRIVQGLKKFNKSQTVEQSMNKETKKRTESAPESCSAAIKDSVYHVFGKHCCCTCGSGNPSPSRRTRHLISLLLRPVTVDVMVTPMFEMLISSNAYERDVMSSCINVSKDQFVGSSAVCVGFWRDVYVVAYM